MHLWRKPSDRKGLYGVSRRRQEQLRQQAYDLAATCRHKRAQSPMALPEFVDWLCWKSPGTDRSPVYQCFANAFFTAVDAYWEAQDQGLLP